MANNSTTGTKVVQTTGGINPNTPVTNPSSNASTKNQTNFEVDTKATVGAFYLRKKETTTTTKTQEENPITKRISECYNEVFTNIKNAIKNRDLSELVDFDAKEFAKNFPLACPSAYVAKYATAAVVMLASGKAIRCDKFLDILFIDLAPLMGLTQVFMGYMSLDAMRLAMKNNSGKFNVVGFLRGLNYGLQTLQNEEKIKNFENLYDDIIPIHLIELCSFEYQQKDMKHVVVKYSDKDSESELRVGTKYVYITLVGHIKNPHGNFTQTNTYIQKLEKCMSKDGWIYKSLTTDGKNYQADAGTLTLRIGNDIYENCMLDELKAEVSCPEKHGSGVYDLKITAKLKYNIQDDESMKENNGITSINPPDERSIREISDPFPPL